MAKIEINKVELVWPGKRGRHPPGGAAGEPALPGPIASFPSTFLVHTTTITVHLISEQAEARTGLGSMLRLPRDAPSP